MWTLKVNGVERGFADLQIELTTAVLRRRNGAASVFSFTIPANFDAALAVAYNDAVTIYRDRTGAGTVWSGGSIYFQGYARLPQRVATGEEERIRYALEDWWVKAEETTYHHTWHRCTGVVAGVPVFDDIPVPYVFLGIAPTGLRWTNGQQLSDALTWLAGRHVAIQTGTVEPAVNIFSVEGRALGMAEVLRTMLAHSPDAAILTDYTTTPPTAHVKKNASLTAVTLTVGTDPISELGLVPRHDLQVPVVVVHFKTKSQRTTNEGTETFVDWQKQVYPPNPGTVNPATGSAWTDLDWETQPGGVVTTIDLEGTNEVYTSADIEADPILANSGTLADRVAWWQAHEKTLKSAYIDPASISITLPESVLDPSDVAVNLATYPNKLTNGTLAVWMGFDAVKDVTIKATASYNLYAVDVAAWKAAHGGALPPDTYLVKKVVKREINTKITVTDAETGTYSIRKSFTEGEPIPVGLAQSYQQSLSTLQYEGTVVDVNDELPAVNLLGCKLTLAGSALSVTNQLIQESVENIGLGTRAVTIGPARVLGITQLMELHRAARNRRTWNVPEIMFQGIASGSGSVQFGKHVPGENTTSGGGTAGVVAAVYDDAGASQTRVVQTDAEAQKFILQVLDADGVKKGNKPSAELDLSVIPSLPEGQTAKVVKLQPFTAAGGGTEYVFATAPVSGGSSPTWLP